VVVVEAGDPTPWTKPDDLSVESGKPYPAFGGPQRVRFNALFADGHVQVFPPDLDRETMRAMVNWQNTKEIKLPR
jgi:prepilin-type processing-associated H-X9-DG protein